MTGVTYPNGTTAGYTYDALSRLLSASNGEGTVSFSYDSLGRIAGTTDVYGYIAAYAYDANGNRTQVKVGTLPNVPPVAAAATYTYDVLNRATAVTDGAVTVGYGYNAVGRLTSRSLPNGVTTAYQYDDLDRLTRLTDAVGATTISDAQYQYDAAGNISQKTDLLGAHSFGYDALDRLTAATLPGESYAYDEVGNRTNSHRSAGYTYQPFNRLTATSTASFGYDANGNLISKSDGAGSTSYTWDYENRLTGVTPPAGPSVTYKYDALGRRVERRTSAGDWTQFAYDGQEVVRDRNGDGTAVEYLNGARTDEKLRQSGPAGTFYFLADHLGSTTGLTDALGSVVEQSGYDSFGDSAGSARTRYGFTGRERDGATGLYYYRARWYDPTAGRFIGEDPVGFAAGVNFYAYVRNNPLNKIDPSGLNDAPYFYSSQYSPAGSSIFDWQAPSPPKSFSEPKVYRCTRPIHGWESLSWLMGHDYLCVDDARVPGGKTCGGLGPEPSSGWWAGIFTPVYGADTFDTFGGGQCHEVPARSQCVIDAINGARPNYEAVPFVGENCWTWASGVLGRCQP